MVNSGEFSGLTSKEAKEKMADWLTKNKFGRRKVNYKLRDWLISRQRYWGAPIPIIYCRNCWEVKSKKEKGKRNEDFQFTIINGQEYAIVPVPEKDLPVVLPNVVNFKPKGKSPLATAEKFVNVKCPNCGSEAKRETDTMDTFVCSSWYYLRFASPNYQKGPFDPKEVKYWLPVDQYVGGIEHAILHLLYARFITKALGKMGHLSFKEPFSRLFNIGMVLYKGAKMSKSKGNVVSPDDMVSRYGTDTVRCYELFMGPCNQDVEWSPKSIEGCWRFLARVWDLFIKKHQSERNTKDKEVIQKLHQTIKKVDADLERFQLNTVVSHLMGFSNFLRENEAEISDKVWGEVSNNFIKLLAPISPHIGEELWEKLGNKKSIFESSWPKYSEKLVSEEQITIAIQVNGKVRDQLQVAHDIKEKEIKDLAFLSEKVKKFTQGKEIKKVIYVPGKILSIVTN